MSKISKSAKIILFVFFLAIVAVGSASALRLGLEFGNPLGVIIIRPAPLDFRVGYNFDEKNPQLFLAGDYRIISGHQLVDFLHFFLSLGVYTQLYFEDRQGDNGGQFDLGARIPIGLQAFLFDSVLELFVEVAPTVRFFPSIQAFQDFHGFVGFTVSVPLK